MNTFVKSFALSVAAVSLAAAPAFAVTVSNMTDKAHDVTVDLGAEEPVSKIEAGKSAKVECPEGCEVRVVGLNSYGITVKSGESLVIKDGMLQHADAKSDAKADGKASKK